MKEDSFSLVLGHQKNIIPAAILPSMKFDEVGKIISFDKTFPILVDKCRDGNLNKCSQCPCLFMYCTAGNGSDPYIATGQQDLEIKFKDAQVVGDILISNYYS